MSEQAQVLGDGEPAVERGLLRYPAELAGDVEGARVGILDPGEDREQRRLAGAVGPDHGQQLAGGGLEGNVAQGGAVAEALADFARLDHPGGLRQCVAHRGNPTMRRARLPAMKVLFVGDVVGKPGRAGLARAMPGLLERHEPDLVIVNGENSAGGLGITQKTAEDLFAMGADVITLGNHAYRHRDVFDYLDATDRVVRPSNFMTGNPGQGHTIVEAAGMRVAVINLIGQVQLRAARSPFAEAEVLLDRLEGRADAIFVDFHAEVTSEKVAMGWHLDGRVGAVVGTHTHVPTADARVLPQGTAFISDVGMTGSRDERSRRPLGAGAGGLSHADGDPLHDGRGRPLGQRRRRRAGPRRARELDRADAGAGAGRLLPGLEVVGQ